jgi:hypothetical protein
MKPIIGILWAVVTMASMPSVMANDKLADKSELYQGKEYKEAFANPVDNPKLPRVLLIGDSISIGYTVPTRKQLAGIANVHRIPVNGETSENGVSKLKSWLGDKKWDVIHFNWGLWDLAYRHPDSKEQGHRDKIHGKLSATPEAYREHLEAAVKILQETGATLIWCNTTPVPEGEVGRNVGDDLIYNKIAEEVMKKHNILIDDLYAHALKKLPDIQLKPGDVHFTNPGYDYLAEEVARSIRTVIEKR